MHVAPTVDDEQDVNATSNDAITPLPREHKARLAGYDALRIAIEQLHASELFQVLNALGGRRGRDVLAGDSAPDLPLVDGGEEELEGKEVA